MKVFLSEEQIHKRIQELGKTITIDFSGKQLTVVGILKGSFIFLADLIRNINLPLTVDFMEVSSYGDHTKSTGIVQLKRDLSFSVEGKDVLIVEDIIDTGLTLNWIYDHLFLQKPASIQIAALLTKPDKMQCKVPVEYIGFPIDDSFVVGYGLDAAGMHRNLPYIAAIETEKSYEIP